MNWLLRQAKARPDAIALSVKGADITWGQLCQRVQRTAAALDVAGVREGARVAALADGGAHYVALAWAAMWSGTTLIPLNNRLPDASLSWQLTHCEAELLVIDRSAANRSLELGRTRFVQIEDLTYSRMVEPVPLNLDAPGTMLYTSGTSGNPRLVRLTWRNHEASATASAMNLGVRPDDNWLCCLPLYHIGGLAILFRSAIYGTRVTLVDGFDEDEVLAALGRDVTIVSLVPTMLQRLVERAGSVAALAERVSAGRLRTILLGGASADVDLVTRCLDAGLPIVQTYGMTEACSQIATMPAERAREKVGSAGLPLLGAEIDIRSPSGLPLGRPGPGIIWIRGPMVTSGYINPSQSPRDRFLGGWFKTGDIGEIDADGFLWVHGRHDDVIVTGGEKVPPDAVERVLRRCPAVHDVAVFPVADAQWGQCVAAAVVVAPDTSTAELDAWAGAHLAPHERPRAWRLLDEIPRTSTGKVRRDVLT